MGLFSKKRPKEKISEKNFEHSNLPRIPTLPDLPELKETSLINYQKPGIGGMSFDSSRNGIILPAPKLNEQNKIKSVINKTEDMQKSNFMPNQSQIKEDLSKNSNLDLSNSQVTEFTKTEVKKPEPIYIRLDKFETTNETLKEAKNKIRKIDDLLKKIKETKKKEETELEEWEKEIYIIKTKLDFIDKDVFNKLN